VDRAVKLLKVFDQMSTFIRRQSVEVKQLNIARILLIGNSIVPIRRAALAPRKITVSRWRLKTVLQNIIYCAVRIVHHARGIELHYGKRCS